MASELRQKRNKSIDELILKEKAKGTPDVEIGKKYGVTFRYIEQLITRTKGLNISRLKPGNGIKRLQPEGFSLEKTTVWSFKQRGNWATHSGEYRGNWSPYIPRNVILRYSQPNELVLDYFCGAGTTAVECKLLGRRCIALDINDQAIELARRNLAFKVLPRQLQFSGDELDFSVYEPELLVGDARNLSFLKDDSVDLICSHPPYANIIHYTNGKEGDLSFLDVKEFLTAIKRVAEESFRVLKPGRQCAILIGDLRRKKHILPLGFKLINVYLSAGFRLRELVIKRQHNCKTTGFWYKSSIEHNFLLLAHEYLPIFEKPAESEPALCTKETATTKPLIIKSVPLVEAKPKTLQTTTVWILPADGFEESLNKNVLARYANGDGHLTVALNIGRRQKAGFVSSKIQAGKGLLYIKSPCLTECQTGFEVEGYLTKIKETIEHWLPAVKKKGFIAIQTQDVRTSGFVEPLAKRIVDFLDDERIALKEIIIVIKEGADLTGVDNDCLKISHQYLLIYEVKQ